MNQLQSGSNAPGYRLQGKKAKCNYAYKATMNDELNLKVDDIIVITQCSEDETWLEGTLNGVTGWFPSNYVQLIDLDNSNGKENSPKSNSNYSSGNNNLNSNDINDDIIRIKYLNELKQIEEGFLDEMCKFVKITLIPLQSNGEIFTITFSQQLNSTLDEVIRCHQIFYQQLKEIPENSDAKIGNLLINLAPQFKYVYEAYAKSNPKFTNSINKKKDQLNKFFESSLSKMSSPLLPVTSNMTVPIYMTKFLVAPFKQLEIYVKILKEIQRYTQDSHIDRGDVQRCIEFYSELNTNIQELRKKKEYEIDIMSSKINNIDEELFKNSEALFLSTALVINEIGETKDRILILFQSYLVILSQNSNTNEFDFELKISFLNHSAQNTIQVKKATNLENLNAFYGGNLLGSSLINKYCFEMLNLESIPKPNSRLLIVCSSQYDMKMWLDLTSNILSKIQFNLNNKSLSALKSNQSMNNKQSNSNSNSNLSSKPNPCTSPITVSTSNTKQNLPHKVFCLRPHPPLIPHFQLPNDLPQTTSLDGSCTLKRFMYKKPKLSEPFGKYHGADDDLKLLNVIDSFCKTKIRQSVNINVQETNTNSSPGNKSNSVKINEPIPESIPSINEKGLQKYISRLNDDKTRLETNISSITNELSEYKKANKELKTIVSSLQKQLDAERQARRKLENFIRKQLKQNQLGQVSNGNLTDTANILMMNVEHESSI